MTACGPRPDKNRANVVFNLDSLLDIQIRLLTQGDAVMNKYTAIGDSSHMLDLEHDSAGWSKELSIFRTADIHKPGLRDRYIKRVSEMRDLKVEEYISIDSSKVETLFLKVYMNKETGSLHEIEALQFIRNPIYRTKRELRLMFRQVDDEAVLDSIYINGFQKMITQDSVKYFTSGKVKF